MIVTRMHNVYGFEILLSINRAAPESDVDVGKGPGLCGISQWTSTSYTACEYH